MTIAFTNLGASANPDFDSNADATSYANSSWTPPTTGLILLVVCWVKQTSVGNVPTVSGNGLTWVNLGDLQIDIGTWAPGIAIFGANASGATTGATTVDFNGQTQASCSGLFCQVTGVDLSGGVAAAIVQEVESSDPNPGTSASVQTIAALGNAANRLFGSVLQQQIGQDQATSPDPQWTALDNFNGLNPAHSMVSQYHPSGHESAMTASWATQGASVGGWVGIAIEIKADLGTAYTKTITDTEGITDALSYALNYVKTLADTEGISDVVSNAVGYVKSLSDTVGLTDVISNSIGLAKTISDTVGITDTLSKVLNYVKVITDTVGILDLITAIGGSVSHRIGRSILRGSRNFRNILKGSKNKKDTLHGDIE